MEIAIQQKLYDTYIEASRWDKKLDIKFHWPCKTPMYLAGSYQTLVPNIFLVP